MALSAPSLLTSGQAANSHGTGSIATASFTPSNNSLLLVLCGITPNGATTSAPNLTVAGGSLSYSDAVTSSNTAGNAECRAWTALVSTGASMSITFDCGSDNIYMYKWVVYEFTGHNTSTPVGATGTATQGDGSNGSVNGALTLTLNASPATTSYVVTMLYANALASTSHSATPLTGFTAGHEVDSATADDYLITEYRTGSTSTAAGWNDTQTAGGIQTFSAASLSVEIKESSGTNGTATPGAIAVTASVPQAEPNRSATATPAATTVTAAVPQATGQGDAPAITQRSIIRSSLRLA